MLKKPSSAGCVCYLITESDNLTNLNGICQMHGTTTTSLFTFANSAIEIISLETVTSLFKLGTVVNIPTSVGPSEIRTLITLISSVKRGPKKTRHKHLENWCSVKKHYY